MAIKTSNAEKLTDLLKKVHKKAHTAGLSNNEIKKLLVQSMQSLTSKKSSDQNARKILGYVLLATLVAALAFVWYETMDPRCIIGNNLLMLELSRPAVSCDVCKTMTDVAVVDGEEITKELFLKEYAYNGIPLLVKGGARNWTALHLFSFGYFKDLYETTQDGLESIENDCQFFPYKTDFLSMRAVFKMSEARSRIEKGEKEWYVGWSNCNPDVARQLRKHYQRPNFLPEGSESSSLDWLFMGGFGGGADVHIDYVQRPSWQAMIAGKKSWKLIPSPECDQICPSLNVTMEKGDIFLVDTNMWYHSTYIHPGEVSITIGSEYD